MATEVGTGYVTIHSKIASDFDSNIQSSVRSSANKGGANFGGAFSVAAGNLLSSGITKALSVITDHMGSAISRVDALNQFPKVMSNIGFSSDEAAAAIDKMSNGIQGLPTTLDDIVGNAQQLAMSIGDLDKASDVAIALNDGFLMFGATSSDVTGAVTQLNQMITAGKYDMQSWNSINQAAPGFLDAVARSMLGAEGNAQQLRDALNDGSVSSEDFLNSIVNLDKNGSDGMASFSEGVQSATGGIETSLSRIDSAITRNMASLIDFIATETDFVGICNVVVGAINQVGNFLQRVFAGIFETCRPIVEHMTATLDELGQKMQPFLTSAIDFVVETMGGTLVYAVTLAIQFLSFLIDTVASVISWFIDVKATISGAMNSAKSAVSNFVGGAIGAFNNFASSVGGAISGVANGIAGFVGNAINAASQIASGIRNVISALPGQALQWGRDIVQSIADGIRNAIGAVAGAAGDIASTIASFLHFSEPDVGPLSNFHTFMPDMMQLMAQGIRDNVKLVRNEVDELAEIMSSGIIGVNAEITPSSAADNVSAIRAAIVGAMSETDRVISINVSDREVARVVRAYA